MRRGVLVGLPVDGRPVVRAQVQQLVALADWELRCPEVAQLGHFREPAPRAQLANWLLAQADTADGFVLSIDMLVYGGLVPSRFIGDDANALLARLDLLRQLKARRPQAPLCAFAATLRISNNAHNEEEKPYWTPHGPALWAWSFHTDRHQQLGEAEDAAKAAEAAARVPPAIREDYRATRARNFRIHLALLDLVEDGVIDRLVLPQDDTAEFGFNIAERRQLQRAVAQRGLQERVLIYPGADEVLHTLCAWSVARARGDAPLPLQLRPSDPGHWQRLHALYEDRPLPESLAHQMAAVGAVAAERGEALLLVHSSGTQQGDWAMRKVLPERVPIAPSFWQGLGEQPVAVADLAFANGGDPAFVALLSEHLPLPRLIGYAGWNTASNRIGSLLAQLVLGRGRWPSAAHRAVLALRLAEDLQWQAVLRQRLRAELDERQAEPERLAARAHQLMTGPANDWLAEQGFAERVQRAWLPWQRSFEIGLELR